MAAGPTSVQGTAGRARSTAPFRHAAAVPGKLEARLHTAAEHKVWLHMGVLAVYGIFSGLTPQASQEHMYKTGLGRGQNGRVGVFKEPHMWKGPLTSLAS